MRLSENFSYETRPRQDNLKNFVRDWDETESLGTFSLETETLANQWLELNLEKSCKFWNYTLIVLFDSPYLVSVIKMYI